MNRREVLKTVGLIVGGSVVGANAFLSGCSFLRDTGGILTQKQIDLLEDIAETILPHTEKSPGAKDAQVGSFMNRIVSDFYSPVEQQVFLNALTSYMEMEFSSLPPAEKEKYLRRQEEDIQTNSMATFTNEAGESFETRPAYVMIKQLAIWGYLSSEIVAKSNFNFLPIPGKFESCIPVTAEVKPMYTNPRPGSALRKV